MIEALPCEERQIWNTSSYRPCVDDQWHNLGCETFSSTPVLRDEEEGPIDYESALSEAEPHDILKIVTRLLT